MECYVASSRGFWMDSGFKPLNQRQSFDLKKMARSRPTASVSCSLAFTDMRVSPVPHHTAADAGLSQPGTQRCLKVIMELAGHKQLTTTQRYIEVTGDMKSKAVGLL